MGCSAGRKHGALSYEQQMKRSREAVEKGRLFEAKQSLAKALEVKPKSPEAERLMAQVISREIERHKILSETLSPETLDFQQKTLQIKTWLERSREFLQAQAYEESLHAAERVFQLDPENREASRLIDEIKLKARQQGKDESFFLQDLYQEEMETRIRRYVRQAEGWIAEGKWGAARLTLQKILILDPKNPQGNRLWSLLEQREKNRGVPPPTILHPPGKK